MKIIDQMDFKKMIYLATVIVSIGVILTTTLKESARPIGVVMIATGGLFFIIGMNKKKRRIKKQ
jgi:predicted membrane channel-forming protein YqfA (hemolysin III family)